MAGRGLWTGGNMLGPGRPQIYQGQLVLRLMLLPLATLGSARKGALLLPRLVDTVP